jgi:hypothetical protein
MPAPDQIASHHLSSFCDARNDAGGEIYQVHPAPSSRGTKRSVLTAHQLLRSVFRYLSEERANEFVTKARSNLYTYGALRNIEARTLAIHKPQLAFFASSSPALSPNKISLNRKVANLCALAVSATLLAREPNVTKYKKFLKSTAEKK